MRKIPHHQTRNKIFPPTTAIPLTRSYFIETMGIDKRFHLGGWKETAIQNKIVIALINISLLNHDMLLNIIAFVIVAIQLKIFVLIMKGIHYYLKVLSQLPVTNRFISGIQAISLMGASCMATVIAWPPDNKGHILTCLSQPPEKTVVPSSFQAEHRTLQRNK